MAEVAGLSLVYPYVEDPHSSGVYDPDNIVLRPVLEIEMLGPGLAPDDAPPRVAALVNSGAERTFAAPWLARGRRRSAERTRFSRFTVTFSRYAQGFAVEDLDVFDQRFDLLPSS